MLAIVSPSYPIRPPSDRLPYRADLQRYRRRVRVILVKSRQARGLYSGRVCCYELHMLLLTALSVIVYISI